MDCRFSFMLQYLPAFHITPSLVTSWDYTCSHIPSNAVSSPASSLRQGRCGPDSLEEDDGRLLSLLSSSWDVTLRFPTETLPGAASGIGSSCASSGSPLRGRQEAMAFSVTWPVWGHFASKFISLTLYREPGGKHTTSCVQSLRPIKFGLFSSKEFPYLMEVVSHLLKYLNKEATPWNCLLAESVNLSSLTVAPSVPVTALGHFTAQYQGVGHKKALNSWRLHISVLKNCSVSFLMYRFSSVVCLQLPHPLLFVALKKDNESMTRDSFSHTPLSLNISG